MHKILKWMHALIIAGGLVLVAGCSDGNESREMTVFEPPPTPPPPQSDPGDSDEPTVQWSAEGVYTGTFTSEVTEETRNLIAFADDWGHTRFITVAGQYYGFPGNPDFPITGITSAGYTWPDGSTKSSFSFDRVASDSADLEGIFSGAGDQGTWSLNRESPISGLPDDGQYVLRDDLENISASFEITGGTALTGSNVDGCVFNGTLSQDGWTFVHSYDVSITVENCPAASDTHINGQYEGMGGLTPNPRMGDENLLLTIGVDNDQRALVLVLEKL